MAALYGLYTLVRNLLGDDRSAAERNGERVLELERTLHIAVERGIQRTLDHGGVMQVLNTFYGLAHFIVTGVVLVWLYRHRRTYSVWRTTIVVTTFLALVGYALFPLAPPRLLPGSGIVDALAIHGGPWNYDSGPISELSNQYAAMPSLHVAWALWCSAAIWVEGGSRRSGRVAAVLYATLTIVTVVATGNHFVLDAVGGASVLALGAGVALVSKRRAGASEAVVAAIDRDHIAGVVRAGPAGEVDRKAAEVVG